jgi:tRNA G18 (ribose-2'-O)-methylase SpoU
MGGVPLEDFEHPDRAVYVLGSEDTGLPESVVRACALHVSLPSVRSPSFNVAVAGSILMYDRYAKRKKR